MARPNEGEITEEDIGKLTDEDLISLYKRIRTEMTRRVDEKRMGIELYERILADNNRRSFESQ